MTDHPFYTMLDEFGQMQLNMVAFNKTANLQDLIFTNAPESITDIIEYPSVFKTDHTLLRFELLYWYPIRSKLRCSVFNYKLANGKGACFHTPVFSSPASTTGMPYHVCTDALFAHRMLY